MRCTNGFCWAGQDMYSYHTLTIRGMHAQVTAKPLGIRIDRDVPFPAMAITLKQLFSLS